MRRTRTHTRACALMCALLMLLMVPGCSCTPAAEEPSPVATPEPAPEPEVVPTPETGEREVLVFFMSSSGVSPVGRTIEVELAADALPPNDAPTTLEPLVRALLEGPSASESDRGLTTPVPAGTILNEVSVAGGTATVDLSAEFGQGSTARSTLERTALIVFALTQFAEIERVEFELDGERLESPGGTRDDYTDIRPAIMITSPLPGESVASPLAVRGESNTFEATFLLEVVDSSGQVVTEQLFTGGGTVTWADFSTTVEFEATGDEGAIVAYELSAEDGSRIHETRVPVAFE